MTAARPRRSAPITLTLVAVALLGAASCGTTQDGDAPPNVIVIIMDTARQDHFSCYGYDRPTTPNLEQLCTEARRFDRAYSTSGWTPPAHASLFTGLYSAAHGTTQEKVTLGKDLTTLAEVLAANGYHCVGISENPMLARNRGFDQGFAEYHEIWKLDDAEENHALAQFRSSLAARDPGRPFFTFINFIEPHSPYNSSQQFRTRFVTDARQRIVGNRWPKYTLGEVRFTAAQLDHLRALYDAELLYVDDLIGKIIRDLKEQDLWRNTVFVVTSDHGENFGDHGLVDHVFSIHETTTHIPLIAYFPGAFAPDSRCEDPVQLVDIFPTVLSLAGIDTGPYPNQGIDLRDAGAEQERVVFCEYYFPEQALSVFTPLQRRSKELDRYKRRLASVIRGDMKYIRGSDGNHELYDLAADPKERTNLAAREQSREIVAELDRILKDKMEEYSVPGPADEVAAPVEMDEKTKKVLRSLGYVR